MDKETRNRLESAGFRIGDAEDFLGLSDEERHMVELRLRVSRVVRVLRVRMGLTQQELARKVQSSQSRIAKVEAAASGVSLDLSFRALFAVGGVVEDLTPGKVSSLRPKLAACETAPTKRPRPVIVVAK